jgi:hypothetical protein
MLPSLRRSAKVTSVYPKELPEWLQLDYFRRQGRVRGWRGPLGLFFAVGGAILMLAISWSPGGHRALQAGPVSEAHALFNDNCATCHDTRFRTAARLVYGNTVRSVTDAACSRCHDSPIHHRRQLGSIACAACHREHQRSGSLVRVGDGQCTACHSDLASHADRTEKAESERIFRDVSGFVGQSHPPFDAWVGKTDPGTIRFSHRKHLKADGVPVVGVPEPRLLRCPDCHRTDEEGRCMQSVRYQRDCAGCHPLSLSLEDERALQDEQTRREAEQFRAAPATHPAPGESAQTVRAELRERLIRFIRGNPTVLGTPESSQTGRPFLGPAPPPPAAAEAQWQWVEHKLDRVERLLFDGAGGCRYCHREITDPDHRPSGLPQYAPPGIGARWFPHSRFSHDRHRTMNCEYCHTAASSSDRSSQIMLPTIATCQHCHNPTTQRARSDCVECHKYHGHRGASRPYMNLNIGRP